MSPLKPVFVCSALRGDIRGNILRAHQYCHWAMKNHDVAPFAPHGFYTSFLDDRDEGQRAAGIAAGITWLRRCDEVWVFVVDGVVSSGMQHEVELALDAGTSVRWFAVDASSGYVNRVVPLPHCPDNDIPERAQLMLPEVAHREATSAIDAAAARLAAGEAYEDIEGDLDAVLGTNMPERNREVEEAWEGGPQE